MTIYFRLALLALLASVVGWNREGMLLISGWLLFLWLARVVNRFVRG